MPRKALFPLISECTSVSHRARLITRLIARLITRLTARLNTRPTARRITRLTARLV